MARPTAFPGQGSGTTPTADDTWYKRMINADAGDVPVNTNVWDLMPRPPGTSTNRIEIEEATLGVRRR